MSKYKTIIPGSHRESLEQSIERKLLDNSLNRRTIDNTIEEPLMSTNKSIIYIKLPKKNHQNSNNFRSSLYEASVKRLKQQKSNHGKEIKIPYILPKKKNFEEFQQQVLKQYNLEKSHSKKMLPNVHSPSQKIQKEKSDFTIFLEQKQDDEVENRGNKNRQLTLSVDKKPFFLQMDQSIFSYQNLKEKYLNFKQNSLTNKRKNDLLQKYQSRSSLAQENYDELSKFYPYKYKMSKEIEEHMNRYNQKDLFQTKLTGFKTNIHPVDRSFKYRPSVRGDEQVIEGDFSNFVKRKKLKSTAMYLNRIETEQKKSKLEQQNVKQRRNAGKGMDCTPWETDLNNFD